MQKRTIWMLTGIIVVAAVVLGGYAIFHKTTKTNPTTSTTNTTTTSKTPTTQSTGLIQTKTVSSVGQYLADSSGNALYNYGGDTSGVSNCSSSCIASWPIYSASSAPSSLPSNMTVITRSDGSKQYAYKGMPLYNFSGDSSGQVNGNGVSNFTVAKP